VTAGGLKSYWLIGTIPVRIYLYMYNSGQHDASITGMLCIMKGHTETVRPRAGVSALALVGYVCTGCGCRFPESRAPKGRTPTETQLLEKIHVQREFARHVCEKRGW
jgi:hypothetical protein